MKYVLTALAVMVYATLGSHLGLFEAVAKVMLKIARCNMCSTFWFTFFALPLVGCPLMEAALLSILFAYLSNYFLLLLLFLQKYYNKLWQRINKRK